MTGTIGSRVRLFLATVSSLLCLTLRIQAQEPSTSCSLTSVARLPLDESAGWFTTTVSINEHPVTMLIDTGAAGSAISPELAARLRLPQDRRKKIGVYGIGGEMKAAHPLIAHSFQLGGSRWENYQLTTVNFAPGRKSMPGTPEGLLGIDLLSAFELEFDFPNRVLTLYTSKNCSGNFVPWAGKFDAIQGKRQLDGQLFIPVSLNRTSGNLNRVAINAVIDTGSSRSSIGIDTAHDVGVQEEELRSDRPGRFFGVSGIPVQAYEHHFDSFTVGQTTYHQAPVFIQDESFGVTQMLLGMDLLRWRKVWVSFGTEQVFLQSVPVAHQQPSPP
jgi:predicted aspartyl protease